MNRNSFYLHLSLLDANRENSDDFLREKKGFLFSLNSKKYIKKGFL